MPEKSNIDAFNDHVSQTFATLYESFPVPTDIGHETFTYDPPEDGSEREGVMQWEYEPIMHAVQWLIEESYIRCPTQSMDGTFYSVQLTEKGLATLQATPTSINGTGSFGKRIGSAVGSGAKEVARKLVEEAIAWGFKNATGG